MLFYHEFENVANWRFPGLYLERDHAVEAEVLDPSLYSERRLRPPITQAP